MLVDFDIKNVYVDKLLNAPFYVRGLAIFLVFCVVFFMSYGMGKISKTSSLDATKAKEVELKNQLLLKYKKLSTLETYKQHSAQLRDTLKKFAAHFPSDKDISKLLDNITKIGVNDGLDFKLFKPMEEVKSDHFNLVPVNIVVVGKYHQFARFISQLMNMERILTVKHFTITFSDVFDEQETNLSMDLVLNAYRQLDQKKEVANE